MTRPTEAVAEAYGRMEQSQPAAWITVVPEAEALDRAAALEAEGRRERALWGVPFAVKDNMDVAGLPTTAACPAFAYEADRTAPAVQRLLEAGAVLVGKTNLDQFATGLVGTRSPYGACHSVLAADRISGGSSSGSAVAVADGVVPFALGTDTAGSGRVPAAANGIVGLKPSRGLVSIDGIVPACRSIDCVSVFARSVQAAAMVLDLLIRPARGADPAAMASRHLAQLAEQGPPPSSTPWPGAALEETAAGPDRHLGSGTSARRSEGGRPRVGVPEERLWGLAAPEAAAYRESLDCLGGWADVREVDLSPLLDAGALLYDGAFVAERLTTVGPLLARDPEAVHPIVREVVSRGIGKTAVDLFVDQHRLMDLEEAMAAVWEQVDAVVCPTVPDIPTLAEVEADPVGSNARLGRWTQGVNLLDLCGVTVPSGTRSDGLPGSVTVLGPSGTDPQVANIAAAIHRRTCPG